LLSGNWWFASGNVGICANESIHAYIVGDFHTSHAKDTYILPVLGSVVEGSTEEEDSAIYLLVLCIIRLVADAGRLASVSY